MGDTCAVLPHPPMFSNVALTLSYELKHLQMLWQEWFWPLTVQCYKTNVILLLLCF